jgi:hypothetical protein
MKQTALKREKKNGEVTNTTTEQAKPTEEVVPELPTDGRSRSWSSL